MEHLILPRNAVVPEYEKAPYVEDEYDGVPFLESPERSRFRHLYKI